ncbi:hypothetical protein [Iodobacter ciconiae]|uniref:Uncharacterized protein n=1 Tax=Iodobacter ciconiae TaxID=2496266 RepID=A0A3S8ZWX0_9NEIS|nr:hypothetical protein [Iodobacter ciconiae]AZN37969.1 hypothetical protein EJO50_16735 [Iodobacter ciconiae]
MSHESESSPLFDKMDALLARHRGGPSAGAIPVLRDEADDIPVLTETVDGASDEVAVFDDILMFPPEMFFAEEEEIAEVQPFEPDPPVVSAAPVVEFLDLPLLDLNALSQANPWGGGWEAPDLPVDEETPDESLTSILLVSVDNEADWEDEPLFSPPEQELAEALLEAVPEVPERSEQAIAELSATVAAQLGVEIATEVEQLTRQHFARLMSTFYEDTLQRLMSDMTIEIEQKLLPRVEELVKKELYKHYE